MTVKNNIFWDATICMQSGRSIPTFRRNTLHGRSSKLFLPTSVSATVSYSAIYGMTDRQSLGEDLEGIGSGLMEVLTRYLSRATEGNHENPQSNRCTGRDSNRAPSIYWCGAPPSYQSAGYFFHTNYNFRSEKSEVLKIAFL